MSFQEMVDNIAIVVFLFLAVPGSLVISRYIIGVFRNVSELQTPEKHCFEGVRSRNPTNTCTP